MDWNKLSKQILSSVVSTSLGESAEYKKHNSLEWFTIRGAVSDQYIGIDPSDGEQFITKKPCITVVNSDIPNGPEAGDEVRFRGQTYVVPQDPENDGHTAGQSLILKKISNEQ